MQTACCHSGARAIIPAQDVAGSALPAQHRLWSHCVDTSPSWWQEPAERSPSLQVLCHLSACSGFLCTFWEEQS